MRQEKWLLWLDGARSPFLNMAIDELLCGLASQMGGLPILRCYSWDRPSASFGYSQRPDAILREGLTIVRRPTGGGAVYHDDDLTYTLAFPPSHMMLSVDRMASYKLVHEAIAMALASLGMTASLAPDTQARHERASLQCFKSPSPHDVLSGSSKIAGAAQRRGRIGLLHQGSISLHGRDRDSMRKALIDALSSFFNASFCPLMPPDSFLESAEKLANLKYSSEAWNLGRETPQEGAV